MDDGIADALRCQCVRYQIIGTTVEVVGCHNMVASLRNVLQRVGNSCRTAGHCQPGHAALQCCHAVLQHTLC